MLLEDIVACVSPQFGGFKGGIIAGLDGVLFVTVRMR
jgi:hypothetical protein